MLLAFTEQCQKNVKEIFIHVLFDYVDSRVQSSPYNWLPSNWDNLCISEGSSKLGMREIGVINSRVLWLHHNTSDTRTSNPCTRFENIAQSLYPLGSEYLKNVAIKRRTIPFQSLVHPWVEYYRHLQGEWRRIEDRPACAWGCLWYGTI